MSAAATTWAWDSDAPPGQKYVLVCYAGDAGIDGVSCATIKQIATKTGLSSSAVKANRAKLIEGGYIGYVEEFRANGSQTRGYTVIAPASHHLPRGSMDICAKESAPVEVFLMTGGSPEDLGGVGNPATGGSRSATGGVAPAGPPRSSVRKDLPGSGGKGARFDQLQLSADACEVPAGMVTDAKDLLRQKKKVNGILVSEEEMGKAMCALAEFNRQAGSDFGLGANLVNAVMRMRERPSYDGPAYIRLVQSAFRHRWWEKRGEGRRPTPGVVFGSSTCFENVVQDAVADAAAERGEAVPESGTERFRTWKNEEDETDAPGPA